MNVEIGTEAAQFLFWEYMNGIFDAMYRDVAIKNFELESVGEIDRLVVKGVHLSLHVLQKLSTVGFIVIYFTSRRMFYPVTHQY